MLATLLLAQSCSPVDQVYGGGSNCLPMTGGAGPLVGIFGEGPAALLLVVFLGAALLIVGRAMRRASSPHLVTEAAARQRFHGGMLAMTRKPQPASVTAVTGHGGSGSTMRLNEQTGRWETARPLGPQGPLARLEHRLRAAGHRRAAGALAWLDEIPLRWPFAR